MTEVAVLDIAQQSLRLWMTLALPLLLSALGVGVLVSLVQAITHVQEMTLTFIPKILVIVGLLWWLMPAMGHTFAVYMNEIFHRILWLS